MKVLVPVLEVSIGVVMVPVFNVPGGKVEAPQLTTPDSVSVQLYLAVTPGWFW